MDTRDVYRGAKSDYYTHCHDLPPQIGGCRVEAAGVPFKDEIDGKDGECQIHPRTTLLYGNSPQKNTYHLLDPPPPLIILTISPKSMPTAMDEIRAHACPTKLFSLQRRKKKREKKSP